MPSTHSTSVPRLLPSSTVMTPSLPTFSMALASMLPISRSPFEAIVPTWAISSVLLILIDIFLSSAVMSSTAFSMPSFMWTGLTPAATALEAFVEDGFGEDGGGGGAVAGDVAGLAGDFLHHLGAHVFVGVFQLNFLGDGDAVFGDGRRAEGFLEDDVAALGAERDFDGSGELLNAATHRVAGFLIEGNHFCHGWLLVFGTLIVRW